MITLLAGTRICIAAGVNDIRRGFDGLAALVQTQLEADAFRCALRSDLRFSRTAR